MPTQSPIVERSIMVFIAWSVLGFLGLGLFLEGLERDSWRLSASGVAVIVAAFATHIVVNGVFATGFSPGETALGIGAYGVLGLVFVVGAVTGDMTMADYYSGLTLFGALAAGFLAYLLTRNGLRGAFSRFHIKSVSEPER